MAYTAGNNGFTLTAREAVSEKADMQNLNDQLAQYIQKVSSFNRH